MHTNPTPTQTWDASAAPLASAAPSHHEGSNPLKRAVRIALAVCGLICLVLPALSQGANRNFATVDPPVPFLFNFPLGINNHGDITGFYVSPDFSIHGYVYSNGVFQPVQVPGALMTGCAGINDEGVISGTYFDTMGFQHGYLSVNGHFTTIDVPGAAQTTGIDFENGPGLGTATALINNANAFVGQYADLLGVSHAYLHSHGTFTTIDAPNALALPGAGTNAFSVNNGNEVAGVYYTLDPQPVHGFVFSGGVFTLVDVPSAGGTFGTQANGINDLEDVVGVFSDSMDNGHGFLMHGGAYTQIDYPNMPYTECHAINNNRVITGSYEDAFGITHGFISTPM
ncbi:MAG TPA: hypothetical protein VKU00_30190 [Chthonomonadaceae bacterium]|nr:hypothetical protein [Chthonomonadaceae bacterium]